MTCSCLLLIIIIMINIICIYIVSNQSRFLSQNTAVNSYIYIHINIYNIIIHLYTR